jgi:hypothetical protein
MSTFEHSLRSQCVSRRRTQGRVNPACQLLHWGGMSTYVDISRRKSQKVAQSRPWGCEGPACGRGAWCQQRMSPLWPTGAAPQGWHPRVERESEVGRVARQRALGQTHLGHTLQQSLWQIGRGKKGESSCSNLRRCVFVLTLSRGAPLRSPFLGWCWYGPGIDKLLISFARRDSSSTSIYKK